MKDAMAHMQHNNKWRRSETVAKCKKADKTKPTGLTRPFNKLQDGAGAVHSSLLCDKPSI